MKTLLALALALALIGCGSPDTAQTDESEPEESSQTVQVSVYARILGVLDDVHCYAGGDIGKGSPVHVHDESDTIVGTSRVHTAKLGETSRGQDACVLTYRVKVDPARFYNFYIDHTGEYSTSRDELESDDWEIETYWGL